MLSCLKVYGIIDEINVSGVSSKISILSVDHRIFCLIIYSINSSRVLLLKLSFLDPLAGGEIGISCDTSRKENLFAVKLMKVIRLPSPVVEIVCSKFGAWAIGQSEVISLKDHILSIIKHDARIELMDSDDIVDYADDDLTVDFKPEPCLFWNFDPGCAFQDSHLKYPSFLCCSQNSALDRWIINGIMAAKMDDGSSEDKMVEILEIPKIYARAKLKGANHEGNPLLVIVHWIDPQVRVLEAVFGISCPVGKSVCFVGHPDGSVLWAICDFSKQQGSLPELACLFSMQQSVVGMDFVPGSGKYAGQDFVFILGSSGKLTICSQTKLPSSSVVSGKLPFWLLNLYLQASISDFAFMENALLSIALDGSVLLTDLSKLMACWEPHSACKSEDLHNIVKIDCIDKEKGLMLLHTKEGTVYVASLSSKDKFSEDCMSLPSLLNECLALSVRMQELVKIKCFQKTLFATLSNFASIKFGCANNVERLGFSICAVNVEPRKYLLSLDVTALQKFDLNPDLCHISVSVSPCFSRGQKLVCKTAPYHPAFKHFPIEFAETDLHFLPSSFFPLCVEVGLILQLPDHWTQYKVFDCLSTSLPFYLSMETFWVHEFNVFRNADEHSPGSCQMSLQRSFVAVKKLSEKRPALNLLSANATFAPNGPAKFSLCLSMSSLKKIIKNSSDVDVCEFVQQYLLKKCLPSNSSGGLLIPASTPYSISVSEANNVAIIHLTGASLKSLIGLRIAIMETIMTCDWKKKWTDASAYVTIPASLYRKCEVLSQSVMNLFGKDISEEEVIGLYSELRSNVSARLPLL